MWQFEGDDRVVGTEGGGCLLNYFHNATHCDHDPLTAASAPRVAASNSVASTAGATASYGTREASSQFRPPPRRRCGR
jgi:hypothetical protein